MNIEGYGQAVIHLAWFRDDNERHLIFGMVELRPIEFPNVVGCSRKDARAENKSRRYLHYRRFVMTAMDAIAWYRSASVGNVAVPHGPKDPTPDDGANLVSSPFIQEPPWPDFVTSNDLVFAPDWMRGSRTNFLFPKTAIDKTTREIVRVSKNCAMLEEWLNFDIVSTYREYQGTICLVAPNQLIRSIEKSHLDQTRPGTAETVAYKAVVRAGQSLDGLRLEVVNERLRGRMASLVHEFGDDAIVSFDLPVKLYKEGQSVSHPKHGLLGWHEPLPLLSAIRVNMELHRRRKRIQVPSASRRDVEYEYEIDEVEAVGKSVVGDELEDSDFAARLVEADNRRSRQRTARDYDQKWFHSEPSEAAQFIRQKIGEARSTVFIIDPYFAGRELLAFGHAIRRQEVQLRILTSASVLRQSGSDDSNVDIGTELLTIMNDSFRYYSRRPSIRVLAGNRSPVHDRFLIVDAAVWLSGNSLNTIGDRAGMIVRLPDPGPVIARLEAFWRSAQTLSDWLSERGSISTQAKRSS